MRRGRARRAPALVGEMRLWHALLTRPIPRRDPYSTGAPGIYLCSSSTPPGGGVHGMCGYWAAASALRHEFQREAPPLAGELLPSAA